MTTEREPGPVWASFDAWAGAPWLWRERDRERARAAWNARQPEIDALKAERDEYKQLLRSQGTDALDLVNLAMQRLEQENQGLRARLAEVEGFVKTSLTEVERQWPEGGERLALQMRELVGLCTTVGCENPSQAEPFVDGYCSECLSED